MTTVFLSQSWSIYIQFSADIEAKSNALLVLDLMRSAWRSQCVRRVVRTMKKLHENTLDRQQQYRGHR